MNARNLVTFILWGLAALFILRTCQPTSAPPAAIASGAAVETFPVHEEPEQTVIAENDVLWLKLTNRGAGALQVKLKDYTAAPGQGGEDGHDPWLKMVDWVQAFPPPPGQAPRNENHGRRTALRLFDPEGLLGVQLDQADWRIEGPIPEGNGGSRVVFTLVTPTGVKLSKTLHLSGARDADGQPSPEQHQIEVEIAAEATPEVQGSVIGDLGLRLGTGGGIFKVQDRFYRHPYAAAARLQNGEVEEMEIFHPSGNLPPRRDLAEKWNGLYAFVVEGSKYFLNAIRPLDRPFRGATCEVLFDSLTFQKELLDGLGPDDQEQLTRLLRAQVALRAELGREATTEELVAETSLPANRILALNAHASSRIAELRKSQYRGAWTRTSVAGDFQLHVPQAGGARDSRRFAWYLGPKDPDLLSQAAFRPLDTIVHDVDYGGSFFYRMFFTGTIAPAILWILKIFHLITGNWGVAIILMTILVRGALFPINRTSQVKMALYQEKVKKVKPQIDAIKKKYAKDTRKVQEETMKLYREHKISPPVAGCLPVFLQMPIFIGLYAALRCSILLRQQPFFGWIHDLARPDALIDFGHPVLQFFPFTGITTLNVLPIIMVVLWVLHQRAMPRSGDAQQAQMQKVMAFMPVMFGIMLYNYASGLSLYMITSSGLGIFEQRVIKKHWPVGKRGDAGLAKK